MPVENKKQQQQQQQQNHRNRNSNKKPEVNRNDDDGRGEEEEDEEDDDITPAHLAIIDCLLRDGIALDLKGYFIGKLPDITSLNKTLIYINLSFNNFQVNNINSLQISIEFLINSNFLLLLFH